MRIKRSIIINRLKDCLRQATLETDDALANKLLDLMLMSGMQLPSEEVPDPEFPEMPNFRWAEEENE
jgi:hypothetical protein